MPPNTFELVPIGIHTFMLEGAVDTSEKPSPGTMWKVLCGKISHITGTVTAVYIQRIHEGVGVFAPDLEAMIAYIDLDYDSDDYPLFTLGNELTAATNIPSMGPVTGEFWLTSEHVVRASGNAGLIVQVMVMVYKMVPKK